MKRITLLALLTAIIVGISVQCTTSHAAGVGEGAIKVYSETGGTTVEKNVKLTKTFDRVEVDKVQVCYTVGNARSVRIVGPEEKVNRTRVTVEDNTLRITMNIQYGEVINNNSWHSVKVYVTAPAFKSANVSVGGWLVMESGLNVAGDLWIGGSSGGVFKSEKPINCNTFNAAMSSGSIVDVSNLNVEKAELQGSSGAITTVKGKAKELDAHFSSGAIGNVESLKVSRGTLNASSGAIVNAAKGGMYETHCSSGAILNTK